MSANNIALLVAFAASVLLLLLGVVAHHRGLITKCPKCYSPKIKQFFHQNHGVCTKGLECPDCGLHRWVDF